MHSEGFFFQAFIYLASAVVAVPIAKRFGLGSVLGYLLAGIIIGPFGIGLIGEEGKDVMHFAEFGVVMMLFLVGLELRPALLWQLRGPILGLGGLQVGVTSIIIMLIGIFIGLSWQISLSIGMILSLSSTAIVLQTLNEKGLMKTDGGQGCFSVLLFQDIAVIPMLAIFPMLATVEIGKIARAAHDSHHTWVDGLPMWGHTLVVFGAIVSIVIVGLYLSRPLFRFIAKTKLREMFTAASLLLVIGIAMLMSQVGLSPALGTFIAGIVLAGNEYRHELEGDIEPFKGLLLGLFFIAVGASVDFALIARQPGLIAGLVLALITLKFMVLFILGRVFKMGINHNMLFAFALAQGGEFAFVLFSYATQNGVIPISISAQLVAVVAISMAITPVLMIINEKIVQPLIGTKEKDESAESDPIDEENPVIIAGFGRFGNIMGRFLRANGIKATILDLDADNVEILRKLGIKVFYGDATRLDLLHAAGIDRAKLLILALDDQQRILDIVHHVKNNYPNLIIMARAYGRMEAYELVEAGVKHVYRETFESSLRMGITALKLIGFHSYQAHRMSKIFRKKDKEDLFDLSSIRHDKKNYLSSRRERIEDLERILITELDGYDEARDMGWDTTSLRDEVNKLGTSDHVSWVKKPVQ